MISLTLHFIQYSFIPILAFNCFRESQPLILSFSRKAIPFWCLVVLPSSSRSLVVWSISISGKSMSLFSWHRSLIILMARFTSSFFWCQVLSVLYFVCEMNIPQQQPQALCSKSISVNDPCVFIRLNLEWEKHGIKPAAHSILKVLTHIVWRIKTTALLFGKWEILRCCIVTRFAALTYACICERNTVSMAWAETNLMTWFRNTSSPEREKVHIWEAAFGSEMYPWECLCLRRVPSLLLDAYRINFL